MACWKIKLEKNKSLNKNSIGIEIQNQGHEFNYKKFSTKQIKSLKNY
jgi:N-acetylmuramoyl-L-alanine amidase